MKPLQIDGGVGEGGGALVRVAIALAALKRQPITIVNVRGNRPGPRGGGLKSQHVTALKFLAEATDAECDGLFVGSPTVTFEPRIPATQLQQRSFRIVAESSAASTLLILQAIFPFLLFAGNDKREPIELEISGGTHVSWSLSFDYLDQLLLPELEERFGVKVERALQKRGWSLGPQSRGLVSLKFVPLVPGSCLGVIQAPTPNQQDAEDIRRVDITLVVPRHAHDLLQSFLVKDIGVLFPQADVVFKTVDDSGHDSRWYALLVSHSSSGIRLGKDVLCSLPKKARSPKAFVAQLSDRLCRSLFEEVCLGGHVDEHLQDQLIIFQTLCEGHSSFPRHDSVDEPVEMLIDEMANLDLGSSRLRREKTVDPFGNGSLHTQTARWVCAQLLPTAEFYNRGDIIKGSGFSLTETSMRPSR